MNSATNFWHRLAVFDRGLAVLRSRPVIRRRTLRRRMLAVLAASGSMLERVAVKHGPVGQSQWLVGVQARAGRIVLTISPGVERMREFWYLFDRLPGVLYLAGLVGRDLEFTVDVSDGHMGFTNVLGFSGNEESVWLVPDPDFFNSHGYEAVRSQAVPGWLERSPGIIWRGSPNGQGRISSAAMDPADQTLIQRVRMCLLLHGQPGIDARLVISDRTANLTPGDTARLEQAGLISQPIDSFEWWQRRFAIDIDGYSNAWSSLFVRLLMGCCVLKVASPTGHRQWYYHRLQPWQHYVPVAADLSDLQQQIEWCRTHEAECEEIATLGRGLALSMNFDTEYQQAAAVILRTPEARLHE